MTRYLLALALGALLAPLAVQALDSSLTRGLSKEEVDFCGGKVAKAPAADKAAVQTGCLMTRQLIHRALSCRPGDYACVGSVPEEVSISYGMNLGEKALIIDLRLGNFFSPIL